MQNDFKQRSPLSDETGFLTVATGPRKYIDIAINLANSLELTNNHVKRAIITDSTDSRLKQHFHIVIPLKESINGFQLKVKSYYYTPFQKTIFIDADSLVIRNVDHLWKAFNGNPVTVLGKKVYSGRLLDVDVESLCVKLGLEYMLTFNGGVYYFEKSAKADEVFAYTEYIIANYDALGLYKHHGNIADEGVMSVAMGKYQMEPVRDDQRTGMFMPINVQGQFKMDILKGYCQFNKGGESVSPSIVHMGGLCMETFYYRREICKLNWYRKWRHSSKAISFIVNLLFNIPYVVYVQLYRVARFIVKREKIKFLPFMPMYRYEY
jgi:hypothetical protein